MKVLIGTTNPSKLMMFQEMLKDYDVTLVSLSDLKIESEPEETGNSPEENARIKATYYGQFYDRVICNDSGLYFEELPIEDVRQPGLHVRTPKGVRLSDEEMLHYYIGLIQELGGRVTAYYRNGFAIYQNAITASLMDTEEAAKCRAFYMIDQPSEKSHPGWPLDSISVECDSLDYFTDEISGPQNKKVSRVVEKIIQENRARTIHFIEQTLQLVRKQTTLQ